MKTDNSKKLKMHKLLSVLTLVVGLIFMAYMIIVEDEPGAIPLLLIVMGAGGYFITRSRILSQHNGSA